MLQQSSSLPAQPMPQLPAMSNTGITGGMGGQMPMTPAMAVAPPMDREAARNARMNQGWQQQLSQQGGMGYGGPGVFDRARPALAGLMRSGG